MKKSSYNSIMLHLIEVFVVIMTIQYMVINLLLEKIAILTYSKEIILIIMTILFCFNEKNVKAYKYFIPAFIFLALLIISTIVFGDFFALPIMLRKYVLPIWFFYLISNCSVFKDNEKNKDKFLKFMLHYSVILSVWGIFQSLVLKDTFLMKLGYSLNPWKTRLADPFYFGHNYTFQRVTSTFSSPNVFAGYLAIVLIFYLSFWVNNKIRNKKIYVELGIIFLALVLTFSRSVILGFIAALLCSLIWHIKKMDVIIKKGVIILFIGFVAVLMFKSDLLFQAFKWLSDSFNGNESSSAGRPIIWGDAIEGIINNPFGIGAGKCGTIAETLYDKMYYACENSYFAIALDSGILGLISYISILILIVRSIKNNKMRFISKNLLICIAVSCFFSNYIYDLEMFCTAYMFFAICKNFYSVRGIKNERNSISWW